MNSDMLLLSKAHILLRFPFYLMSFSFTNPSRTSHHTQSSGLLKSLQTIIIVPQTSLFSMASTVVRHTGQVFFFSEDTGKVPFSLQHIMGRYQHDYDYSLDHLAEEMFVRFLHRVLLLPLLCLPHSLGRHALFSIYLFFYF